MSTLKNATINAIGVFGRLETSYEKYFHELQCRYYRLAKNTDDSGIFPHLTLVVSHKLQPDGLLQYLELLRNLKPKLPFDMNVDGTRVIDGQNIAYTFDISQTKQLRDIASTFFPYEVIKTDYITMMRKVPEELQGEIMHALLEVNSLTFTDFKLCINRIDDSHILHSSFEF